MRRIIFILFIIHHSFIVIKAQTGWHQQNSGTTNKLNSIFLTSTTFAFIAGNNGTILRTTNGGLNWQSINSGTSLNLNSIIFRNSFTGIVVGDNGFVLRTTNAGTTWTQQTSGTSANLYSITSNNHFIFTDTVYKLWVAGSSGTIIKSTNNGTSWFAQNSGVSNDLRSIFLYYINNLFAAGSNGTIIKTDDGGNFWYQQSSGTSNQLNSLALHGDSGPYIMFCAGNNGTILKTTNLGINWYPLNTGIVQNLNSIEDNSFTWAVGANGTIILSSDVGTSWTIQVSNTSVNLNYIKFIGVNTGWAVGDIGTIRHIRNAFWSIDSSRLNANTINTPFINNGQYNIGFEWPKGENKFARYASGLWLGAKVGNDTLVTVAEYYSAFLSGFTNNNGQPSGSTDPAYRVYRLSYGINDSNRVQWPNALLGNSNQGAPVYFDIQSNSWKPLDFGDQTMFYSFTDSYLYLRNDWLQSSIPLKSDIKQLNFCFDEPGAVGHLLFTQYTIINRSSSVWNNVYITFWSDDDLGEAFNDRVGCDTNLQLGYTYNGSNYDPIYGSAPPAVGFILLKGPVVFTNNPNDTAFICSGRDKIKKARYKNLKMSVFNMYTNGDPQNNDPVNYVEAYRYMTGLASDGSQRINPVTGQPTKFMFSGDPVLNTGWVHSSSNDHRIVMSVNLDNFNPGDTQTVVIGQVIARGTSNLNSITRLREYTQAAHDNYNNCFINVPIALKGN